MCVGNELSEYMYRGQVVKRARFKGRVVRGPVVSGRIDVVSSG